MKTLFLLPFIFLIKICWAQEQRTVCKDLKDSTIYETFDHAVINAQYPGGFDSLRSLIIKDLKYPSEDVMGIVFVEVVIDEDGYGGHFKIKKGICKSCDENAIEVLTRMRKWAPATKGGKPVRQRMVIPVKFF
jgi:protein TonB